MDRQPARTQPSHARKPSRAPDPKPVLAQEQLISNNFSASRLPAPPNAGATHEGPPRPCADLSLSLESTGEGSDGAAGSPRSRFQSARSLVTFRTPHFQRRNNKPHCPATDTRGRRAHWQGGGPEREGAGRRLREL